MNRIPSFSEFESRSGINPTRAAAARWLAEERHDPSRPKWPQLREQFGLTAIEALDAIRLADQWRAERR
ncbi:hypothetical protein [Mesorhizobium sp. LjNodule214]|uniref:hypothetical protein n=1 Tax=Mesorhizobium sp. LjNodule214 TaxID=3342252 RepID=UPI003ECD49B7